MKNYASVLLMSLGLLATSGAFAENNNIILYYNGPAVANTEPNPTISAFQAYCNGACAPTTQFPLVNPFNNQVVGVAHVWGANYHFGLVSECFTEFIEYKLQEGTIYTLGNTAGTCGAFIDPSLVQPSFVHNPNASLIAGGGAGNVVAGTGKYKNLKGTYVDRVFVEFVNGAITYYDALYFTITPTGIDNDRDRDND